MQYEHWTEIESHLSGWHRGTCRCGWRGESTRDRESAVTEMKVHKSEITGDHQEITRPPIPAGDPDVEITGDHVPVTVSCDCGERNPFTVADAQCAHCEFGRHSRCNWQGCSAVDDLTLPDPWADAPIGP